MGVVVPPARQHAHTTPHPLRVLSVNPLRARNTRRLRRVHTQANASLIFKTREPPGCSTGGVCLRARGVTISLSDFRASCCVVSRDDFVSALCTSDIPVLKRSWLAVEKVLVGRCSLVRSNFLFVFGLGLGVFVATSLFGLRRVKRGPPSGICRTGVSRKVLAESKGPFAAAAPLQYEHTSPYFCPVSSKASCLLVDRLPRVARERLGLREWVWGQFWDCEQFDRTEACAGWCTRVDPIFGAFLVYMQKCDIATVSCLPLLRLKLRTIRRW